MRRSGVDILEQLTPLLEGALNDPSALANLDVRAILPVILKEALLKRRGEKGTAASARPWLTKVNPQATLHYWRTHGVRLPPEIVKGAVDQVVSEEPPPMTGQEGDELYAGFNARFEVEGLAMNWLCPVIQGILQQNHLRTMTESQGETGLQIYVRSQGQLPPAVVSRAIHVYGEPGVQQAGGSPEGLEFLAVRDDFFSLLVPQMQFLWHTQQHESQQRKGRR